MDKRFNKVIKKMIKAGVTPNELSYLIFSDMHEILCSLERAGLGLEVLLEESKRKPDCDELVERIEQRVKKAEK